MLSFKILCFGEYRCCTDNADASRGVTDQDVNVLSVAHSGLLSGLVKRVEFRSGFLGERLGQFRVSQLLSKRLAISEYPIQ